MNNTNSVKLYPWYAISLMAEALEVCFPGFLLYDSFFDPADEKQHCCPASLSLLIQVIPTNFGSINQGYTLFHCKETTIWGGGYQVGGSTCLNDGLFYNISMPIRCFDNLSRFQSQPRINDINRLTVCDRVRHDCRMRCYP